MTSERLSTLLDAPVHGDTPLDRLIKRLQEERELGYYDAIRGDDMLRVVIKWAEKYKNGEV